MPSTLRISHFYDCIEGKTVRQGSNVDTKERKEKALKTRDVDD